MRYIYLHLIALAITAASTAQAASQTLPPSLDEFETPSIKKFKTCTENEYVEQYYIQSPEHYLRECLKKWTKESACKEHNNCDTVIINCTTYEPGEIVGTSKAITFAFNCLKDKE